MGKLPHKELAYVATEKLSEYCLNETHPYGKEKAIVFKSVLGITRNESEHLKSAILNGLHQHDCIKRDRDEYGERYTVCNENSYIRKRSGSHNRLDHKDE